MNRFPRLDEKVHKGMCCNNPTKRLMRAWMKTMLIFSPREKESVDRILTWFHTLGVNIPKKPQNTWILGTSYSWLIISLLSHGSFLEFKGQFLLSFILIENKRFYSIFLAIMKVYPFWSLQPGPAIVLIKSRLK